MRNVSEHTRSLWQNLRSKTVFLACSGGVDSMVLLHLLSSVKVNLKVIHVNYQLRGEDSNLDAKLIESVCSELKIPLDIKVVDLNETLKKGGNLQNEARKVRYNWFQEILTQDDNNRIALAHHQDDQVETFLMNLARKSGVMGLSCMKHEHNRIVRPLLDFSKAEIVKYALNHKVRWREDQSNDSNNYTRNRLRNEFIPFLKTEIPTINSSILTIIHAFQHKQLELENKVLPIAQSIFTTNAVSIVSFEALSELEQVELFRQLDIPASYVSRLIGLNERGKQIALNKSSFQAIVRDEHRFTFLKTDNRSFKLITEKVNSLPTFFDKKHAYFDAAKLNGDLKIRIWEIGDRISPIGMKGSQLISDIIKDAKITADAKRNQLVVYDETSILWCVGLKISRKAIASSESEKILCCSISDSTAEVSEVQ